MRLGRLQDAAAQRADVAGDARSLRRDPGPGPARELWFTALSWRSRAWRARPTRSSPLRNGPRARSSPSETAVRLEALVAVLYAFIVFMSLIYLGLAATLGSVRRAAHPDRRPLLHDVDHRHGRVSGMSTPRARWRGLVVTLQIFLDLDLRRPRRPHHPPEPGPATRRAERLSTSGLGEPRRRPSGPSRVALTSSRGRQGGTQAIPRRPVRRPGGPGHHGLAPAADAELAVERLQVHLHGVHRHEELAGDLLVAHHARQQLQDRELAVGERDVPSGQGRRRRQQPVDQGRAGS